MSDDSMLQNSSEAPIGQPFISADTAQNKAIYQKNTDEENQTKNTAAIDEATLAVMVEALAAHEAASNLNRELLEDICIEAFAAGKLNDIEWLEGKLSEVTGEHIELGDLSIDGSDLAKAEAAAKDHLDQIQISQTTFVESEEDLQEVLRLHEIWMNSVLTPRQDITGGRANLRGANLSGFNLVGADLRCADLRETIMIGTNLHSAQLSNAWLQGADLQGANLTKANLKRAKLEQTDLREANLTEVDMESADFTKATLTGQKPPATIKQESAPEETETSADSENEALETSQEASMELASIDLSDEISEAGLN